MSDNRPSFRHAKSDTLRNSTTDRHELWRERRRAVREKRAAMAGQSLGLRAQTAIREMKEVTQRGSSMGTRKIVSMQKCADAGLVKPVLRNGMITDWQLTAEGEAWDE